MSTADPKPSEAAPTEADRAFALNLIDMANGDDVDCQWLVDEIAAYRAASVAERDAKLAALRAENARLAVSESEVAGLRAALERVRYEVDGYIDGAPDCNAVSKLANQVSLIIDPT